MELGGTVTGEHGIGTGKISLLQDMVGVNGISTMLAIKQVSNVIIFASLITRIILPTGNRSQGHHESWQGFTLLKSRTSFYDRKASAWRKWNLIFVYKDLSDD